MSGYAITYLILLAMSGTVALLKHGEQRTGSDAKYSFPMWLFSASIVIFLLTMGGFFR